MSDRAQDSSLYAEVSQLKRIVEQLLARQERESRIAAILDSAGQPQIPPSRRRRDRHGLHAVKGLALPAAVAVRWLARSHAHRVVAAGLIMATAAGSTLTSPDMMQPVPSPLPAHHAEAHHRRAEELAPISPARRKRRRSDHDETVRARAPASASAPGAGRPAGEGMPDPGSPGPRKCLPSLLPRCAHHRKHHAGDAVAAAGALPALPGLPWPAMGSALRTLVP